MQRFKGLFGCRRSSASELRVLCILSIMSMEFALVLNNSLSLYFWLDENLLTFIISDESIM